MKRKKKVHLIENNYVTFFIFKIAVVSKPVQYEISLSIIRSSLSHLEEIAVQRSPMPRQQQQQSTPPLPPPHPHHTSPQQHHHQHIEDDRSSTSSSHVKTPPPLPPKPARMHNKPTVPPKPSRAPTVIPSQPHFTQSPPLSQELYHHQQQQSYVEPHSVATSTTAFVKRNNRGRGNSVSFAEQTSDHEISDDDDDDDDQIKDEEEEERAGLADDDDDDDDDDEVVDFDNNHDETRVTMMQRSDSIPPPRPHTMTDPFPHLPMIDTRPRSLTTSHHHQHQRSSISPIDVLNESIVDARILVPAQTNTGDSLAPPTASQTTDYVPNIPVPPLLTTHRRLQNQLDDLETALNEYKSRKRALTFANEKSSASDGKLLDSELNDRILQHTTAVAETRETLNRVRTLYMSAATVPNVMQFPPHLVAYQLTLIECAIFRDIPPDALLSHTPRSPHPKVVASTDFFNYITRAIEHSILLPQEASRRAELINRWIKVATKCLSLSNYQTLKAIVSALGTPPVQRLRRTWDCIPKKRMGRLDLLNALMSESENYGRYREHMGLETKRRWTKPVVPFLGVFIHDMTYLLAAVKAQSPQGDARVQDVVNLIHSFQRAPAYPQRPPPSYVKASRKHSFGPSVLTNALHRTASSKNRMSNSSALFGVDVDGDQGIEVEQQLITQYLLMRPWVSEKIIDELSVLREPPKQRGPSTSPGYGRSNNVGNMGSAAGTSNNSGGSMSSTSINTSSILSNASSLVRLSSSYSTNTSSMTSWEDHEDGSKRSTGFWPFRKSSEMTRPTTLHSDVYDQRDSWSDEQDDPSSPPLPTSTTPPRSGESISSRTVSTTSKILTGHVRSFSLPSAKPSNLSDTPSTTTETRKRA
ncbi:hypothetical protein BDA99DRAFT_133056 [Phascolomyces articulosus]|uniref:Ras-GEF domain-containing protein n=1 Tax=Phascolomyces articulosus TaxID=60185 RepID=A0AAD5JWD2_9FUNG|nr:hypothetical protein BDA99DRAFT_133056 [Phascolomyces articulosus]